MIMETGIYFPLWPTWHLSEKDSELKPNEFYTFLMSVLHLLTVSRMQELELSVKELLQLGLKPV